MTMTTTTTTMRNNKMNEEQMYHMYATQLQAELTQLNSRLEYGTITLAEYCDRHTEQRAEAALNYTGDELNQLMALIDFNEYHNQ